MLTTRKKKFEDTRWAIKSRKSKKLRQYNDQNKKEKRTSNDLQNVTQKTGDGLSCQKGNQYLRHMWHLSCYSCSKPCDESWMSKGLDYD